MIQAGVSRSIHRMVLGALGLWAAFPAQGAWTGGLSINGGAPFASTRTGRASLSAASDAGAATAMRLSWNGTTFTSWEAFAPSRPVTLPAGDGPKTLWVQFQDARGEVSPFYQDAIVLDTSLPAGTVLINGGATRAISLAPAQALGATLALSATDATSGVTQMQFSKDGATWTTWEPFAPRRAVALLPGTGTRSIQVRFRDAAGNVSVPAIASLQVVTASASLVLDGGAPITNARPARLALSAEIGGQPPVLAQFSWDGIAYTSWEAYRTTRPVTLPDGDGPKSLRARFQDAEGNTTPVYTASLMLDTTAPTGGVVINGGAARVAPGQAVTLGLSASDANLVSRMQFSLDGSVWTEWEAYASTRSLSLAPGSGLRSVHARFQDGAGNVSTAYSDTITVSGMGAGDFLKASGRDLRKDSGTGEIVRLRGTNLGGLFLQEAWMSPLSTTDEWTLRQTLTSRFGAAGCEALLAAYRDTWIRETDLDNIQSLGMNVVRLPLFYLDFMDASGNWRADPWTRLDALVEQCAARGLYVLLDLHGTFGGQNTFDNCGQANSAPQLWVVASHQDNTVRLWEGLAQHYRGNPAVAGYDLLNEPDRVSASQLGAFYDRLYRAIRAIDPDHTIFLEAAWDWNQLAAPGVHGWTNVVYELHYYAMAGNEAQNWDSQNAFIDGLLQGIRDHQGYDVPVYAGEFCVFAFEELWGKLLAGFNQLGVHYTNWSYKVNGGGNWGFYHNTSGTWPDIGSGSIETIASAWRTFDTATHFQPNTALQNAVKPYLAGRQMAPLPAYWALRAGNGKYVCALNEGRDPVAAVGASPGTWEWFQILEHADGTLSLRAKINAGFLCADLDNGARLIANRGSVGTWEKFRRVDAGSGQWALQSVANNLFVTVDASTGAMVATGAGSGAAFTFVQATWSLKSAANASFVSADLNLGGQLVANRASASGWEAFSLNPNADGSLSLRAAANGKYVSVVSANGSALMASADAIGSAEKFVVVDRGGGAIALRSVLSGACVMANLSAGGNLMATAPDPGDWETFFITPL